MAKRGAGCWESRLSGSVRDWGATDVWPRYCGTTGKPGGNREYKPLPAALGVPSLLENWSRPDLWGGWPVMAVSTRKPHPNVWGVPSLREGNLAMFAN